MLQNTDRIIARDLAVPVAVGIRLARRTEIGSGILRDKPRQQHRIGDIDDAAAITVAAVDLRLRCGRRLPIHLSM